MDPPHPEGTRPREGLSAPWAAVAKETGRRLEKPVPGPFSASAPVCSAFVRRLGGDWQETQGCWT